MNQRSVLLISSVFPPDLGGRSDRMGERVEHFARHGWKTLVLAPALPPDRTSSRELATPLKAAADIQRPPYLFQRSAPSLRHDKHRKVDVHGKWLRPLRDLVSLPRGYVRWLPHAVRVGRPLAARADAILSVSNPIMVHAIAYALKRASGNPWVAEFCDPIVGFKHANRGPEFVNTMIERLVVRRADRVVRHTDFVPDPIALRYPDESPEKFVDIPYTGFNESDFADVLDCPESNGSRMDRPMEIAYTGSFYGDAITPVPFLRGLRRFLDASGLPNSVVRVTFAGEWLEQFSRVVQDQDLEDCVRSLGVVSRQRCLEIWRASDALLLILAGEGDDRQRILSKFWDYVGARRPILALVAPDGRVADLVRKERLGYVAPTQDEGQIAVNLSKMYEGFVAGSLAAGPSEGFLASAGRSESERQLVAVLNRLCEE